MDAQVIDSYRENGKLKDAAEVFNHAAEKITQSNRPENLAGLLASSDALASQLIRAKDVQTAVKVMQHDLALKVKSGANASEMFRQNLDLAKILSSQGELQEAEKHFKDALKGVGRDEYRMFAARQGYGRLLEASGRPDEAERLFRANVEHALKSVPSHSAFTDLASLYQKQGKHERAEDVLRAGVSRREQVGSLRKLDVESTKLIQNFADVLKRNGKNDEAARVVERQQFSQLMWKLASHRGTEEERTKDFEQAYALFKKGAATKEQSKYFLEQFAADVRKVEKK
jgi:tetratricopeptide (TPR) repeat protein